MRKGNLAEKVLDYWFALEFLSQDSYPESRDVRNRIKSHKEKVLLGTNKNKTIPHFISLNGDEDLYEILSQEAYECGMKKWGNLTIYIGKVKRETCIECISEILPFHREDGNRPEKNLEKIAWVSLQLSPDGNYVEHSLSLSTIIWALNQIKNAKGNISDSLDGKLYNDAKEELEKKFLDKESTTNANISEAEKQESNTFTSEQNADEEAKIQTFSASAISLKKLHDLYEEVEEKYIKVNIQNREDNKDAYEEIYGISFQLFADETTKEKKEDDNYLGLDHDYYSDDIKLVIDRVRGGALVKDGYMGSDILKYVTVLEGEDTTKNNRIDLVDPKEQGEQEYLSQINEILSVENAPLGKWPSIFMPAFMQQMAVNLAIGKGTSALYHVNGNVFSVNGPPGTGKTTLLKEIVVNNIIERAILLSKYDDPNDAFVRHDFIHGEREENAYSTYTRHWYSLKNDAINNYSMLVTSCNNAAVENISKELPKSIVDDLTQLDDDSEELRDMISNIGELFAPAESEVIETTHQGKKYKDVYFTEYARNLLNNSKAWGLVAAPLGKKSNLSNFYKHVLYPLGRDFYQKKDMAPNRVKSYTASKTRFEEQLKVVRDMQNNLRKAGDLFAQKAAAEREEHETVKNCNALISTSRAKIESANQAIKELIAREEEYRTKAVSYKATCHQVDEGLSNKKRELKTAKSNIKAFLEKEICTRKPAWTKIFGKAKYEAAIKLADEYKKDAENQRVQVGSLESEIKQLTETYNQAQALYNQTQREFDELKEQSNNMSKTISTEEKKIADCVSKISKAHTKFESVKQEYESEIAKFAGADAVDTGLIIDEEFVSHLLSNDVDESTTAQVSNPWFTQRYNREREKLFGYAMRMNKEFVVSSNYCRDNFAVLSHYWGFKTGDENERIIFHKEDKEHLISALFQTLFLLVPVLSSTFASVGTFFRDVKQPGIIGMLVVDEAGQAQPQMALGALYRSRRAVIVGDPKQVEPVVTDELILLKKAYSDEALKPYKKKSLSVQGFADRLNTFGTYLHNGTDYPEWVGCPLMVHRRCISPMYDVSNEISYNGIMKQQTKLPKQEKAKKFIYDKSQWINVKGLEKGNKNHFVEAQGQEVCELLEIAFSKNPVPSIYIISPFTTVVSGIKDYIGKYCRMHRGTTKINSEYILDYDQKKIGTVHTFQGKEAEEVIFLLGCDTSEKARGAIEWVNKNIVNVAATRAEFRLYVIGDEDAWKFSTCISMAKEIIDTLAIKEMKSILADDLPEQEMKEALVEASRGLPSVTSFSVMEIEDENGVIDYSVDTSGLIKGLNEEFLKKELSTEQLERFGFNDMKDLDGLSVKVKENLLLGMKLFFLLEPVYELNNELDASCCAILFCKAMDLQMKNCFTKSLKEILPDYKVEGTGKGRDGIALKDVQNKELTLRAFDTILKNNGAELGRRMKMIGKGTYDEAWWSSFENKLGNYINRRNKCYHSGVFSWKEQSFLLFDMFKSDHATEQTRNKPIGGILFESVVGKSLATNRYVPMNLESR